MALTDEEKAKRKAAQKARDAAWRARRKLRDAREAELRRGEYERLGMLVVEAREEETARIADLYAWERAWAAELDALRAQHQILRQRQEAAIAERRQTTSTLCAQRNAEEERLRRQIETEFPDLRGDARWSATCWTPLVSSE